MDVVAMILKILGDLITLNRAFSDTHINKINKNERRTISEDSLFFKPELNVKSIKGNRFSSISDSTNYAIKLILVKRNTKSFVSNSTAQLHSILRISNKHSSFAEINSM